MTKLNLSNIKLGQKFSFTFVFTILHWSLDFYLFWSVFRALIVGVVADHFQNHLDQVGCFLLLILFHTFLLHFSL